MRFVELVSLYADNVINTCDDKYGDRRTPLLVDAISPATGEPRRWENHITSNLACQQHFLRLLDALTIITADSKYHDYANEWIASALEELHDPASDMLYWGGHSSYDLLGDKPLIGNHELKCVYPYYDFFYRVSPRATERLIAGIWNKHVRNWSNLLFNRHGDYGGWDKENPWAHEYVGGELPIIDNSMLSFINTGSDLIYAGAQLFKLSGDVSPLTWAKRLLGRYREIRNPETGLGGYQFNHREPCRVRISFREPFRSRQDVNETTVITAGVIRTRFGRVALVLMNLFETLGNADGSEFLDTAVEDLSAIAEYSYDEADQSFVPLLADGTRLAPENAIEGAGYCSPRSLNRVKADGLMFLVYSKAYRLTQDDLFRRMVESLACGIGWDGIFEGASGELPINGGSMENTCALLGLLELHKATGERKYLELAVGVGEKLAEKYFSDGFFTEGRRLKEGFVSINNTVPLALLHTAAAVEGEERKLPTFYPGSTSFDPKVIISRRKRRT